MFGSLNFARSSRFLIIAGLLAASVPATLTIGTDGAAYAAQAGGRGGGGGGGGGGNGGDGGGDPLAKTILTDYPDTPKPQITYLVKKGSCEIRTCEIDSGVRKCSTTMTDIKVCSTKRS